MTSNTYINGLESLALQEVINELWSYVIGGSYRASCLSCSLRDWCLFHSITKIMEPQCIFCDDSDDDPGDNLRTPNAGINKIKQCGRLFPKSKVAHRLNIIPEDQK